MTHPLWPSFLAYDRQRLAGTPDLQEPRDRELWELFQHAHALGVTSGRQDAAHELSITTAERDHYRRQSKRLKDERDALLEACSQAHLHLQYAQGPKHEICLHHVQKALICLAPFFAPPVNEVNPVNPVQDDDAPLIREDGTDDDFIRLHHQVMQEMTQESAFPAP